MKFGLKDSSEVRDRELNVFSCKVPETRVNSHDAVELGAFVVEWLSHFTSSLLSCAKSTKVLRGLGNVITELNKN